MTVEDPVEYELRGVNQVQIRKSSGADLRGGAARRSCARTRT